MAGLQDRSWAGTPRGLRTFARSAWRVQFPHGPLAGGTRKRHSDFMLPIGPDRGVVLLLSEVSCPPAACFSWVNKEPRQTLVRCATLLKWSVERRSEFDSLGLRLFENCANSLQRGAVGLSMAVHQYQKLGYIVCLPLVDGQDYDLVVEKAGGFQTVQCRTTNQRSSV